ncbi:restriction endonuclease subunit S [Vreelandella indica]|uniref:restriction endonuclease subunit S n=1 Tax=Vreelandella indica TaxID=3126500 RepID=UPI00300DE281
MSYPAYPEYKDSGVEWLGEVPAHWEVKRLKHLLIQITDRANRRSNPIALENIESWSGCYIETESDFSGEGIAFQAGDLLFGKLRPYLAKVYLSKLPGEALGDFHVIRPSAKLVPQFAFHQLLQRQFISVVDGATHGAKMPRVGWEVMGNMPFINPPTTEQKTIATFLDHETARIDALVEEQKRLIALLKEKRQAVISHAVTKGLDPNVPMKDSGVEWLGEVPAHWEVLPAKFLFNFITSGSRGWAEHYSDDGELFFRITNLTRDTVHPKLESIRYVSPPAGGEGERARIQIGDILISITADLGSVCVASEGIEGGYVSQHVALARPNHNIGCPAWLAYFVLGDVAKAQLLGSGYGGTKVQLSLEDIREMIIALPPKREQHAIYQYLDGRLARLSALLEEASNMIIILKERRSALISAAVTGKIDVRGWQPPMGSVVSTEASQLEAV